MADCEYQPVGYLTVEMPLAEKVATVTLDGEVVPNVFALNDEEGWVEHYGPVPRRNSAGDAVNSYLDYGVVRVQWEEVGDG